MLNLKTITKKTRIKMEQQLKDMLNEKKSVEYAVKSANATIQDVDMSKRIVTGFFNTFNFFDSDCDVLLTGCAAKSITERGPASTAVAKIKHLIDHNWSKMPGKIQVLEEKTVKSLTGIYFETKMANTTLGNDTLINYQEQVYDNHSFGFRYISGKYVKSDSEDWTKYLQMLINPDAAEATGFMYLWDEVKMWEGTTTAFGANSLTPYLGVKSMNKASLAMKVADRITVLEKQVRNGNQSDDAMQGFEMQLIQLKQLISELFVAEPSIKDTMKNGRTEDDTQQARKSRWSKLSHINN